MNYYSTNRQSPVTSFREAAIRGQAPDGGLYFPEHIPALERNWLAKLPSLSREAMAFDVIKPYVGDCIPEEELYRIVSETVQFPIPLVRVNESIQALELFHGPTLAFKDIGARFMSRCLGYFMQHDQQKVTVLVATSGDTGGAVANGFYNVPGVEVVILYPSGKVSDVQEKQLTTLGGNIRALEVKGSFDDCQRMVKQAFSDTTLTSNLFLTSANSINVARWLPQQFYYFFALRDWQEGSAPVISVPSGNFGNICAGMLAAQSGLPVGHFIAACNANDVIPRFMNGAELEPKPAIPTLSNAMDVGNPSNFVRILELFQHKFPELAQRLSAVSISDSETEATIRDVKEKYDYLLDPHGAVGFLALQRYLDLHPGEKGIFLETAHPVKFPEAVERITGKPVAIPQAIQGLMHQPKQSVVIDADFTALRDYLMR